jgi:ankyrin repeat protein
MPDNGGMTNHATSRRIILLGAAAMVVAPSAHAQSGLAPALLAAAGRGDAGAAERLLGQGAPREARDGEQRTPLMLATRANHVAVARVLIAAGADVNAKDAIEDSPFLYAGAEGRVEILKLTLAAGADLASLNRYGGTALIPACHHGHVEAVKVLLGTRIDRDHINRLGWTALLEAVILGSGGAVHTEIVRLLAAGGANVNIADREGVTPLGHARGRGFAEIARILSAAGGR